MELEEAELMAAGGARIDQDDESKRYTEGGINVAALDRRGRGLRRARPEALDAFERPSRPGPAPRLLPLTAIVLGLLAAAVVIALLVQ